MIDGGGAGILGLRHQRLWHRDQKGLFALHITTGHAGRLRRMLWFERHEEGCDRIGRRGCRELRWFRHNLGHDGRRRWFRRDVHRCGGGLVGLWRRDLGRLNCICAACLRRGRIAWDGGKLRFWNRITGSGGCRLAGF